MRISDGIGRFYIGENGGVDLRSEVEHGEKRVLDLGEPGGDGQSRQCLIAAEYAWQLTISLVVQFQTLPLPNFM